MNGRIVDSRLIVGGLMMMGIFDYGWMMMMMNQLRDVDQMI